MRNITKKVVALALSLVFSVSAFAQLHFNTLTPHTPTSKVIRGEEGVDYSKYAASEMPKVAGVNITVVSTDAFEATFQYDKNDSTYAYYVLYGAPGLVEFFVQEYNYTHYQIFHGYYLSGQVSLYDVDTTETIGDVFPGDSIVVYTLAMSAADDTIGALSYKGLVIRPQMGDDGRAEVTLTVSNITDNSCDVATEMNASTTCYYFAYGNASQFLPYSQNQIITSIRDQLEPYVEDMQQQTLPNLTTDTTYTIFIVPYNAKGELGEYIAYNVTPGGGDDDDDDDVSIRTANGVQFSIYPNPATSVLNVAGDDVERVELYDAKGQCVVASEKNAAAQINVNNLAKGLYLLKVYSNGKVGTQKVMVK